MKKRWIAVLLCAALLAAFGWGQPRISGEGETYDLYFLEADLSDAPGGDALRAEPLYIESGEVRDTRELAEYLVTELLAGPEDAALTSAISILESLVAFLTEEFHLSRARAAIGLSVPMALLSAGYSLSQSAGRGINLPWFDFKNGLQMLPMNAVMEKFTDNLMIPLGALCFCLFVGWVWGTKAAGQEIAGEHGLRRMQKPWAFAVRFLAPLVIVVILYFTLGMGEGLS